MINAETFKQRLLASGIATEATIVPVSEREFEAIENRVGIKLPDDYQQFLLTAGKCAGVFMDDCDFYYPEILGLNENAKRMLDAYEDSKLCLPESAFVFLDRREQFLFFHGNTDSSGMVYRYFEESSAFEEWSPSFWQFVEDELKEVEDRIQRHPEESFWRESRERAVVRARSV